MQEGRERIEVVEAVLWFILTFLTPPEHFEPHCPPSPVVQVVHTEPVAMGRYGLKEEKV